MGMFLGREVLALYAPRQSTRRGRANTAPKVNTRRKGKVPVHSAQGVIRVVTMPLYDRRARRALQENRTTIIVQRVRIAPLANTLTRRGASAKHAR